MVTRIGVISDTHGLLRPEAVDRLKDSDHIIHAGDIGSPEILVELGDFAPVTVVMGNVDTQAWCHQYPKDAVVELGGKSIYVVHDIHDLDLDPKAAGFDIVVTGHSHVPKLEWKAEVWHLNPGSAGRRRFKLPISVASIVIASGEVAFEIKELSV